MNSSNKRWVRAVFFALILASLVAASVLATGCASSDTKAAAPATTSATSTTVASASGEKMTITDQAGRPVTIPKTITKVYGTSPIGTNITYMLAPEKLVGWCYEPQPQEKKYVLSQYQNLPNLGGWYGKNNTGNIEAIIKAAPDLILSVGDITDTSKAQADRIQQQLKIPVVMVDGTLAKSGDTFRYIGKLIGAEARAEQLATYCDKVIAEAKANTAKLKDSEKVKIYYAEGNKGLNTDPAGSQHTEVFDLVGAVNVAQVKNASAYGMAAVSMEQVLAWNPGAIFVASDPSQKTTVWKDITTASAWSTVKAVKDGAVYQIPHGPFDWCDRPPCTSRVLGVLWVGHLLYPNLYNFDMKAEVKSFYKLFYQMDLTDAQYAELTANAGIK